MGDSGYERLFRSDVLFRTLVHLALREERQMAIEELVDVARATRPAVLNALAALAQMELIERHREARRYFYRINIASPLFPEIRGIAHKSIASGDLN